MIEKILCTVNMTGTKEIKHILQTKAFRENHLSSVFDSTDKLGSRFRILTALLRLIRAISTVINSVTFPPEWNAFVSFATEL